MQMNTLEEWLEVQGRLINIFDRKYGFKRLERYSNGDIGLVFDGVGYTADRDDFINMDLDDLPSFVNAVEQDISKFWGD